MRNDLNKQLCERERHGHEMSYKTHRHDKKFHIPVEYDGEEFYGISSAYREGMKKRYINRKSFNENLRPLYGLIHKSVGRKWDDVYSEICSVFDKRSVINQHILIHLFQFVAHNCILVKEDGLYVRQHYEDVDLSASHFEYYVDPHDGVLKKNGQYRTYRQRFTEQKKRKQEQQLAVRRVLDKTTELRKVDGLWYEVKFEDVEGTREIRLENSLYRKNYLRTVNVYPLRYDVLMCTHVGAPRVAVSKRSLSRKEIKKYGLK